MSGFPRGTNVSNIFEGFRGSEVFRLSEINECLSIKVDCGGRKCLALIDTCCMVSVVYKTTYEEMDFGKVERNGSED